jgi:hypothetical protein
MKLLTIILLLSSTLGFSQSNLIHNNDESQKLWINLLTDYRASHGLNDSIILDTTGSACIQHKADYNSIGNKISHSADPNNSWKECGANANRIANSGDLKYIERGSYEIGQWLKYTYSDTTNLSDSIQTLLNSNEFWVKALEGWKSSPSHNSAMLDSTSMKYSMRAKEYKYYISVAATYDPIATVKNADGSYTIRITVYSTLIKMGHGKMYETDSSGHIITSETKTETKKGLGNFFNKRSN